MNALITIVVSLAHYAFWWVIATGFMWWVTDDNFDLTWDECTAITLSGFMILVFYHAVDELNTELRKQNARRKREEQLRKERAERRDFWNSGKV